MFNEKAGIANRGTFPDGPYGLIRFAEMNQPGERDQGAWKEALVALPV